MRSNDNDLLVEFITANNCVIIKINKKMKNSC